MDWGSILSSAGQSVSSAGAGAYGAGMAGGLIGGLYQPFISQHWAANAGNQQFDLDRWWAVNQASLAVKGLRKAGLNPLLAVLRGDVSGGAQTGVPYASFDSDSDIVGRAVSSARAAASVRGQLDILREQVEQEKSRTFGVFAETARSEAEAKIAEANRDIANATKDALITSAKQGADQSVTTSDSLRAALEIQRAQLPSAKAQAEFDASPAGQMLIKAKRGAELSPKVKAGALGTFGVE